MLVKTVGIDAIQGKASADGVALMAGAVAWPQQETDAMVMLVDLISNTENVSFSDSGSASTFDKNWDTCVKKQ